MAARPNIWAGVVTPMYWFSAWPTTVMGGAGPVGAWPPGRRPVRPRIERKITMALQ